MTPLESGWRHVLRYKHTWNKQRQMIFENVYVEKKTGYKRVQAHMITYKNMGKERVIYTT